MKLFDFQARKGIVSPASRRAGFTLIELLIAIGILGILAAGLLVTLDPLEQLRKAQDSIRQQASKDFSDATTRYFVSHLAFPWDTVANGGAGCNSSAKPSKSKLSALSDCLIALIKDAELKSTYKDQTVILNSISVTETTDAISGQRIVVACFNPESKASLAQATFNEDGSSPIVSGGTAFWCAR